MTMIERVARAICEAEGMRGDCLVAASPETMAWQLFIPSARAAIQAMREPTKEMCSSGDERCGEYGCSDHRMREIFRAMIDAALSETSEES